MTSIAAWPSLVVGPRASIAAFADSPSEQEADWLEEAAQAIAGRAQPCRLQDRLRDGDHAWWILGDGNRVGALSGRIARLDQESQPLALVWTWLAVEARWRAYGYGGAAVPLLEDAARAAGATVALAPLPPDNGVALYFWLRLGYTPLRSITLSAGDWPSGVSVDALWMQRSLPTQTRTTA